MKEDSVLKEKIGTKNPFRTPEGYFDTFSERIMQQIFDENKEKVSLHKRPVYRSKSLFMRIRPYLYLAAMLGGIFFGLYIYNEAQSYTPAIKPSNEISILVTDEYIDDLCDFAMVEEGAIYDYIVENY